MFRAMARSKQQLAMDECTSLLRREKRGVLSVLGDDDYPYGVPINHFYCEEDGKLYFHGGKNGHKIDAIRRHDKVSFCVYDSGYKKDGDWALNVKSVIVFGRIEIVEEPEKTYEIARKLSHKFTDDEAYIENEIRKYGPGTLMFALVPEHVTGKIVKEA